MACELRFRWATLLLLLVIPAGCNCAGSEERDAGVDVPLDVPEDTPPLGDAGPWRPAFAPRIIYRNPDVTCTPTDLTYTPPVRPSAARGEVRWVYRPLEDPLALGGLAGVNADPFQFGERSIFGTTDGGLVVNVDADRGTLMVLRPDGTLRSVLMGLYSPVRLTIGPVPLTPGSAADVLRAAGDGPRLRLEASGIPVDPTRLPALPGLVRTEMPNPFGWTWQPDPVLLEDGTVIWSPTTHTLFASCLNGGQTRWILEFDGSGGGLEMAIRGDADGGMLLVAGYVYRLSGEGALLAEREPPPGNWRPGFYTERCGLAGTSNDTAIRDGRRESVNNRVVYLSGPSLESERTIPVGGQPTSDCGVLSIWTPDVGSELSRFDPAGERTWTYPRTSQSSTIELSDGSTLIIWEQGERAPGLTIIGPDGAVTLDQELDPAMVGTQLTRSANYLTPEGVLYLASQGDFEANPRLMAIEIGVPPAYPSGDGLDWARTNAAWLTSP